MAYTRFKLLIFGSMLFVVSGVHAQNYPTHEGRAYIVQGSTTFTHRIMEPHQAAIEKLSGHKLTIVPSKSSLGLLALFEKRGDFAMISGPLENEIERLKASNPNLPFEQLQAFNVANTRMAFAVNKDNPVRKVSDDQMRRILSGEITNWREVGGRDLPIKIVQVRAGGGVQASIETELLGGKRLRVPNPIRVQISSQVIKITEQLPEALGLSQLGIVRKSKARELKTEHPIEQHLDFVTLGEPTPEMREVINAARQIMSEVSEK
jgi:phosphate transport system substrate-binding protein